MRYFRYKLNVISFEFKSKFITIDMRFKYQFIIIACMLLWQSAQSQEAHFSYYQFTPVDVNPANAGAFHGSYRVSGIYSDNYGAITSRPYRNLDINVDAPIIRGFRKQDWVGVGIGMLVLPILNGSGLHVNDDGTPAIGTTQVLTGFKGGLAYHLSLDKKQTRILTLGAQFASGKRSYQQLSYFDARIVPENLAKNDADIDQYNQQIQAQSQSKYPISKAYSDINIGVLFNSRQKKSDLKLGFVVKNVNKSSNSLFANNNKTGYKRELGLQAHGAYDMTISNKVNVIPGFFYYSYGNAWAFNVNTHAMYTLRPQDRLRVGAGLGLRNFRSIMTFFGAEYKSFKMGFNFDIDITSLAQETNGVGGFELCLGYIGTIYKKPKTKQVILCPRL